MEQVRYEQHELKVVVKTKLYKTLYFLNFLMIILSIAALVTLIVSRDMVLTIGASVGVLLFFVLYLAFKKLTQNQFKTEVVGYASTEGITLFRAVNGKYDHDNAVIYRFDQPYTFTFKVNSFQSLFIGTLTIEGSETIVIKNVGAPELFLHLEQEHPNFRFISPVKPPVDPTPEPVEVIETEEVENNDHE